MRFVNTGVNSAKHDTQELFEALQTERSAQLASTRDLQLAVRLLMQAEQGRLAKRNPADVRLAHLATLDGTLRERLTVLDSELEIAAIRVPPVTKAQALVHGRITDDAQRAPGRLSVQLVRADGSMVPGTQAVEVDDSGYYAFVLDDAVAAQLPATERLSVVLQRDDATVAPTAAASFTLAAGSVAVKDVALSATELQTLKLRTAVNLGAGTATAGGGGGVLRPRTAAPAAAAKKATAASKAAPKAAQKAAPKAAPKAKPKPGPKR